MTMPTPDFYTLIHKSIRLAMSEFLAATGAADAGDRVEWQAIEDGWLRISKLLDAHSRHEDTHVHPLIRRAAPDIAHRLDEQHEQLDTRIRALDEAFAMLGDLNDRADRATAARLIYRDFSIFVARYFDHLIEEETSAMPVLLANVPWEDLFTAHRALVGSIPLEERLADLPFIARSLSAPERIMLMAATRSTAPPAFFAEACRIMKDAIGEHAFARVETALESKAA